MKIPESQEFLPDDINLLSISREYLLSVSLFNIKFIFLQQNLETVAPAKYVELYNSYKNKLSEKTTKKWSNYEVYMNQNIAEKLKAFIPTDK